MPYSNNVISAPVGVHDVQQALGTTVDNVGSLCLRNNINKWARYKPERADGPKPLIYGSGTRSRKGNNFGLDIPYCQLAIMNHKAYNLLNEDETGWDYLKPRGDRTAQGGVKEFYRLSDFARILTDTSDPFYNTQYAKGYNHNARIPFDVFLNLGSAKWKSDYDGDYLEVNVQVMNELAFSFINSVGDELHLQDFINITAPDAQGRAWRSVLQIFRTYYDQDSGSWVLWQNNSQPYVEVSGPAITTNEGDIQTVALDLTDSRFTQYINQNAFLHLCVGIGCCNQTNPLVWKETDGPLFIVPYTDAQLASDIDVPFYYRFKLVSYQARQVDVIALSFFSTGSNQWVNAGGTPPYFTINSLAADLVRITMTISKLPTQKVDFIPENGTPDSGYTQLKIQARETITGMSGETIKYLNPTDSSWHNASHTHIDEGQLSDTQTIYATMYLGNIPVGGYGQYHLYANTGGSDWDNIGYFSVQKIQY